MNGRKFKTYDLGWACMGWAGLVRAGLAPHSPNNFHEIWNILLHFSFSVPSVLWRLYFVGGDGIYRSLDITKGKKTNDLFPPPLYFFPSDIDPTLSSSFLLCSWSYLVWTAWTIEIWWKQKLRFWNKSFRGQEYTVESTLDLFQLHTT